EGRLEIVEVLVYQPQISLCLPKSFLEVTCVRHSQRGPLAQGHGQRVLADHPDRREFDLDAALPVVAVAQQQVLVRDVVSHDPDVFRELRQDPHTLPVSEGAGRVVDGGVPPYNWVKESECVTILQQPVT